MDINEKELVETLIRGRNSARKLQNLLRQKVNDDGLVSVDDLVTQISESFHGGLLVLNSCNSGDLNRVPASNHEGLAFSRNQIPKGYTGDVGKKPATALKGRRGCYKRRKTIDSRMEVSDTIEDGYEWRKYGQKEILNSEFPRCYFRCTHKHTHGCKALKQVQKSKDESFHITYFGYHTCPPLNTSSHPEVVLDCKDLKNHHYLPNSLSTVTNNHIDPSLKQDLSDNIVSSANDAQSVLHALVWNEILIDDTESFNNYATLSDISFEDILFS